MILIWLVGTALGLCGMALAGTRAKGPRAFAAYACLMAFGFVTAAFSPTISDHLHRAHRRPEDVVVAPVVVPASIAKFKAEWSAEARPALSDQPHELKTPGAPR